MPAGFAPVATRVDQNGDPLVLVRSQTAAASGIYRVVSGALATVAAGLSAPYAFCEDIDSGHFIVTDSGGAVLVVSRTGTVIQTRPNVFPANTGLALHEEYPTGGLLAAAGSLLHYDVSTGTLTTVLPAVSGGYFTLDGDPINDGHYAAGGQGIDWLDRSLVRTQVQRFGLYAPLSVVTWGSRMLTGRARLPFGDKSLATWKVVQPMLEILHCAYQGVVLRQTEEDIVEGQVPRVVGVEIARLDGRHHFGVERSHLFQLGGTELTGDRDQGHPFEGTDDFVDVADVLETELVDHHTAPRQDRDESFRLELDEGIAQGGLADAQILAEELLIQVGTRMQLTTIDGIAQILVDLLAKGSELENPVDYHSDI